MTTDESRPVEHEAATEDQGEVYDDSKPFASAAAAYLAKGWLPLPMSEPRGKSAPPAHTTGWTRSRIVGEADVKLWISTRGSHNLAVTVPNRRVLGVDIDLYKHEDRERQAAAVQDFRALAVAAELPATWRSGARFGHPSDPLKVSGIYWFTFAFDVAQGMLPTGGSFGEFVHFGHRYALVSPSVHPDLGTVYRWFDAKRALLGDEPPALGDLPMLSEEQSRAFVETARKLAGQVPWDWEAETPAPVTYGGDDLPDDHADEDMCRAMQEGVQAACGDIYLRGARHDTYLAAVMQVARLARFGHRGWMAAREQLRADFEHAVGDDRRAGEAEAEFGRMWEGAVVKTDDGSNDFDSCRCDAVLDEEELAEFAEWAESLSTVGGIVGAVTDDADEAEAVSEPSKPSALGRRVAEELIRLKARDEARRLYDAERAAEHREDWDALFIDESELGSLVVPPALIEAVLPRGSNAILRGRDGTFKTFVALDWALHIASGRTWDGHGTEPGAVLYIAGEGAYGIRDRVTAWRGHHGVVDPLPLTLRKAALNFYAPGEAFEHLLAWVEGHKIRMVVIDTLRRVSGNADGNGSGMGAVIDSVERVKTAMAEVGGSTLTITHTDKGDNDTRGFSGVEDDIDVVWHARREEGTPFVTLFHKKMKDGPELSPVTLKAEPWLGSLVLTSATGAGGVGAEVRILTFLTHETDEKDDGETAAVILTKTGLSKRTGYDALERMVARGEVVLTKTTRPKKYAAAATLARYL